MNNISLWRRKPRVSFAAALMLAASGGSCGQMGRSPEDVRRNVGVEAPSLSGEQRRSAANPPAEPTSPDESAIAHSSASEPSLLMPTYAATTPGASAEGVRWSLEGEYLFGSVRGSVQTPSGGQPGTTSNGRPSLKEIGIDHASIVDVELQASWGNHSLYLGGELIEMSGSKTLRESLISQGNSFAAGDHVHSKVNLDWYRLGYEYQYVIDAGTGERPVWTLRPSIGAALFTFDYRLRSDTDAGSHVSRSYSKALPQVGLEAEWRPGGGRFSISGGAQGFPAIGTVTPGILTEHIHADYQVIHGSKGDLTGFVGVAFEQFDYKDRQHVPNRVKADFGPMLIVGLRADF
jgi:hypothetical protein